MSDSSEEEDLSKFRDVVDNSFVNKSKIIGKEESKSADKNRKSERYLETSAHYNDVVVPEEMKKQIGAKMSAIIQRNVEFVEVGRNMNKKRKIKGGVKLFRSSDGFLSCEEPKDTYTEIHNSESKKIKIKKRQIDEIDSNLDDSEKISSATVTGEYILSKEETKHWKSRRKEKLFKYKPSSKKNVLISVE
ncbi:hypothetical protein O3G_MSEX014325 [Manduca sexta]|uniref:Protein CUSTOS n=1 Tax=Manduca sexta TaxID=7130 RepID=A0A921ZUJ4_MANSE|nr:hypothetical protein O3G_MSEX014325 [Manduca sexta]